MQPMSSHSSPTIVSCIHGRALGVAAPRSVDEVSRLLAFCNEQRIGVVPQGGNTGYCGGATPDESGTQLVVSLKKLDRIREIDALEYSITAEAGCVLANVQAAADEVDRFFPLSLGSEGSCQLGGNLSTNAGGTNVLRYGMTRELVLGLEVVLADGRVLSSLAPSAQGQHRLRCEVVVPGRRGHARHHHGGEPQALSESARKRHGLRRGPRRADGRDAAQRSAGSERRSGELIRIDSANRRRAHRAAHSRRQRPARSSLTRGTCSAS